VTDGDERVLSWAWNELVALFMDEGEKWARALTKAAARPIEPQPYVKSEEEREQDRVDWQIYQDQKRDEQKEVSARAAGARRALQGLQRLTDQNRKRRERFVLYCPATRRPCPLYVAYAWTPPPEARIGTDDTLLVVGSTRTAQRAAFPSWPLTSNNIDPDQWLPVGCRHGRGRFPIGVPGAILREFYTAETAWHSRRISDLLGVADVAWIPVTPMLSET
jgi:hypothetical protein